MPDAQFYWSLFLETGAPEAYVSYKNAVSDTKPAQMNVSEENNYVF